MLNFMFSILDFFIRFFKRFNKDIKDEQNRLIALNNKIAKTLQLIRVYFDIVFPELADNGEDEIINVNGIPVFIEPDSEYIQKLKCLKNETSPYNITELRKYFNDLEEELQWAIETEYFNSEIKMLFTNFKSLISDFFITIYNIHYTDDAYLKRKTLEYIIDINGLKFKGIREGLLNETIKNIWIESFYRIIYNEKGNYTLIENYQELKDLFDNFNIETNSKKILKYSLKDIYKAYIKFDREDKIINVYEYLNDYYNLVKSKEFKSLIKDKHIRSYTNWFIKIKDFCIKKYLEIKKFQILEYFYLVGIPSFIIYTLFLR